MHQDKSKVGYNKKFEEGWNKIRKNLPKLLIGVDPGKNTGLAFYNPKTKAYDLFTKPFWEAIKIVDEVIKERKYVLEAYIEDPNQNPPVFKKKFNIENVNTYGRIAQNIGMNKRDAQLWFNYFKINNIVHFRIRPTKGSMTKLDSTKFKRITKHPGRTSEHSRDAAMLVWDRK